MSRRLASACAAIAVTSVLTLFAVHLGREYYQRSPYFHDPAGNRQRAMTLVKIRDTEGGTAALRAIVHLKDGFDIAASEALMPWAAYQRFGHLWVELPLFALFLWLLTLSVWKGTGSGAAALAVPLLIFTSKLPFSPQLELVADLKDNTAAWILGGAALRCVRLPIGGSSHDGQHRKASPSSSQRDTSNHLNGFAQKRPFDTVRGGYYARNGPPETVSTSVGADPCVGPGVAAVALRALACPP